MQRLVLLIGTISIFLAACGGGPQGNSSVGNTSDANSNSNAAGPQFAEITDPNIALAEGKRLLDENLTESAIAALKRAVELDPDLAEAHFNLGIAHALLEMQNQQAGITTEPASTNSNGKNTVTKTASDKAFEEAVKAYKKWLAANPKDDNAHYYLGRTYAKLMKDDEAEEAFQEAVKIKPEDTEYQTELGAILIKLARYQEAIKPLKKAIELDDANGRAYDLLEDAEAGRRRVDYVQSNKNSNSSANKAANANTASNSNSASPSNSDPKTPEKPDPSKPKKPEPEVKGKKGDTKDGRSRTVPNKPK